MRRSSLGPDFFKNLNEKVQGELDTSVHMQKWEVKVEARHTIKGKNFEHGHSEIDESPTPVFNDLENNFEKRRHTQHKFVNLVEIPNAIRLSTIESTSPLKFF